MASAVHTSSSTCYYCDSQLRQWLPWMDNGNENGARAHKKANSHQTHGIGEANVIIRSVVHKDTLIPVFRCAPKAACVLKYAYRALVPLRLLQLILQRRTAKRPYNLCTYWLPSVLWYAASTHIIGILHPLYTWKEVRLFHIHFHLNFRGFPLLFGCVFLLLSFAVCFYWPGIRCSSGPGELYASSCFFSLALFFLVLLANNVCEGH